jgi:hypothetical protein
MALEANHIDLKGKIAVVTCGNHGIGLLSLAACSSSGAPGRFLTTVCLKILQTFLS